MNFGYAHKIIRVVKNLSYSWMQALSFGFLEKLTRVDLIHDTYCNKTKVLNKQASENNIAKRCRDLRLLLFLKMILYNDCSYVLNTVFLRGVLSMKLASVVGNKGRNLFYSQQIGCPV